ncbi:TetR/AcrR family transcriptional regulator [Sphingomonas ginkgonis]|uniref:TetR/AcrR family transcriptional regulator n=1 Tax=Sphingomonas ginkgonis TaxID=2315330 RepID=A0A3R9X897_9SPHN|nr:TetR/AcrR family transcriptional regulator [Sphingomonas ginkgonis]RST31143.1 TetR/AcrR family transcriptional regulator [Sphingomonas ginkgonis]
MSVVAEAESAPSAVKPRSKARFQRKREAVLDAATDLINQHGARGTTLLEVARAVGLNTTSVTYYFRKKEQLAAAVFERSLERLHDMVRDAAAADTPQQRVRAFVWQHFALRTAVIRGEARPLASLSDVRTLDPELRTPLEKRYQAVFRDVRTLFGEWRDPDHKALLTARAHMLLEVVFWLPVWLSRFAINDFERVADRLQDILEHGLATGDRRWAPRRLGDQALRDELPPMDPGQENFLRVATRLINESGYRGASVARIVDELNVTKGSFYHHLDAKDDLVLQCFRTSYKRIAVIQWWAHREGRDEWDRLTSAIAALLDLQFSGEWPLTRTTAIHALPPELRREVVERSDRTALRFSGTLIDGGREGSLRLVDPVIASQLIMSTFNSAYDLRSWASSLPRETAIRLYASTLVDGLFDDRSLSLAE